MLQYPSRSATIVGVGEAALNWTRGIRLRSPIYRPTHSEHSRTIRLLFEHLVPIVLVLYHLLKGTDVIFCFCCREVLIVHGRLGSASLIGRTSPEPDVSTIDLRAGRKAKAAAAYASARAYFSAGMALLDARDWGSQYE